MQKVYFNKLLGDPLVALETAYSLYTCLREAAMRENDLRTFVSADMTVATLDHAKEAFADPMFYAEAPHYYKAEAQDELEKLYLMRLGYVQNYAIARA